MEQRWVLPSYMRKREMNLKVKHIPRRASSVQNISPYIELIFDVDDYPNSYYTQTFYQQRAYMVQSTHSSIKHQNEDILDILHQNEGLMDILNV